MNPQADVYAGNIQLRGAAGTAFTLYTPEGENDIQLALLGEHNVVNAVAAAAAAMAAGASGEELKRGLESVQAVAGRLKVVRLPAMTVIDDSYNASPGSVMAAIDVLAEFPGRRCLLLATMGELGADAERLHLQVAAYAKKKGIEQLLLMGEFAAVMAEAVGKMASSFNNFDELRPLLAQRFTADVVLVKGSRFTHMERAVEALVKASEHNRSQQ